MCCKIKQPLSNLYLTFLSLSLYLDNALFKQVRALCYRTLLFIVVEQAIKLVEF